MNRFKLGWVVPELTWVDSGTTQPNLNRLNPTQSDPFYFNSTQFMSIQFNLNRPSLSKLLARSYSTVIQFSPYQPNLTCVNSTQFAPVPFQPNTTQFTQVQPNLIQTSFIQTQPNFNATQLDPRWSSDSSPHSSSV